MTARDYINIPIETLCVLICVILFVFQLADKKKNESNKWFSRIIFANTLMLLGDIFDCVFGGAPGVVMHYIQIFSSLFIYYSASGIMLYSMMGWVMSYVTQHVKVSKGWILISRILMYLQFVLAATMQFTKICYVDSNNVYHRSSYFYLAQFMPYIIYFMALFNLIRFMRFFKVNERVYLAILCFLPVVGVFIQSFHAELLLLNVTATLGLVLTTFFVQLQRDKDRDDEIRELIANENIKLEEIRDRQETLNSQLIDVLCGAVEAKDLYTRGHSLRVAQYAREIMYRLGGDEKAQNEVYSIGILHDVGKIRIPDEIINKKGALTDEEFEQIKLHTVAGYQILKDVTIIPELAIGARWHHERYDGKGYPTGLAGENIPLVARIISVADAYDAMTSSRSYHSIMPQCDVRAQIENGMGTQFDPKIAQIMLDMIDEDLQYEMKQNNYSSIRKILMVDDDPFMHDMAEMALDDENYVISFAKTGKEGIELLEENKYDLCILDLELPDMDGFAVMDSIHKNIRGTRVIFLTGEKDINTIKRSEEFGAEDYITKPVNSRVLRDSVYSVLNH